MRKPVGIDDTDPEHDMETHFGKGMLKVENDELTIVFECNVCGRFQVGPMPANHTASIATQMLAWAKSVGLPVGTMEAVEELHGPDRSILEDGAKKFEAMSLRGDKPTPSAWDGRYDD